MYMYSVNFSLKSHCHVAANRVTGARRCRRGFLVGWPGITLRSHTHPAARRQVVGPYWSHWLHRAPAAAPSSGHTPGHSPPPALRWLRPWQRGTSRQPATAAAGATATAPRRTGPCSCRQWLNVKGNTKLTHVAGAGPAAGCQPVSGSGGGRVASATLDLRWTEPPPSGGRAADELTYREPLTDVNGNGSGQSVACVAVPRSCITADSGRHCRHVDIQPQSACWRARGTQPRRRDGVVRPPSG